MNRELPDHIPPEKNLVWKAAKLLQERCHITDGIDIYLEKIFLPQPVLPGAAQTVPLR